MAEEHNNNSIHPRYNSSPASTPAPPKLRLMCSNGGHIVTRPHDKSLCYVGGETRIVVVDRHTTLLDLTNRLSKTLFRSSSSSTTTSPLASSFTLKYQLPSEDLDSLISVTTDEDLENMIDEYERLNSSSSRLRLFIFPTNLERVSSIDSFLENPGKSDDWFLNALNCTNNSGFSDTSSVNCLLDLGLNNEISFPEKKDVTNKGSGQDVHSIPNSPMMETTSSFGSASSTPPSHANLPAIRVKSDDDLKTVGGIEEQFLQMGVQNRDHKHQNDGCLMASSSPAVVSGSATAILQNSDHFLQQSTGSNLASMDSILSDLTITDQSSPVFQRQSSFHNNRSADPEDTHDRNTRIQMQQQTIHNSSHLLQIPATQINSPRHQLHHQQPQFTPPLQYTHHHPSVAVPATSYYQHYPHPPPMDQQNFMYYVPTRPPPQPPVSATPNNLAAGKTELPAGVYRNTNISGAPQIVRIQNQAQSIGYSEFYQPSQPIYYATQAVPPLSTAQYQNMVSNSAGEASLQEQHVRTSQP